MKHIIFSIVCFAFVLFAGGHNEPGEKYLSLDLLKNEIDDLRRQMEDENDKVQSQVRELKNENDQLKSGMLTCGGKVSNVVYKSSLSYLDFIFNYITFESFSPLRIVQCMMM